jgi:hypothetical protein
MTSSGKVSKPRLKEIIAQKVRLELKEKGALKPHAAQEGARA